MLAITSCSIQSPVTAIAFVVLGLLMGDQNLHVVKIALAVVAPWTREDVLDVWVVSLLFGHFAGTTTADVAKQLLHQISYKNRQACHATSKVHEFSKREQQ